jgi:hypothetical protein
MRGALVRRMEKGADPCPGELLEGLPEAATPCQEAAPYKRLPWARSARAAPRRVAVERRRKAKTCTTQRPS